VRIFCAVRRVDGRVDGLAGAVSWRAGQRDGFHQSRSRVGGDRAVLPLLGFGLAAGMLPGLEPGDGDGVAALAFLGGNGLAVAVVEGPDPDAMGGCTHRRAGQRGGVAALAGPGVGLLPLLGLCGAAPAGGFWAAAWAVRAAGS
jgi:hypothetical protein